MSAMRILSTAALYLLLAAAFQTSASATASDWVEVEGGRVRLVTAGAPDAGGTLQGVLEIDLHPGWKTYWRDPGYAGVPPQIDVSRSINVTAAEMRFPAPERFDDGFSKWAGYKHPVAFPVTFTLKTPGEPTQIEADVFLGICETICIPVKGTFALDPANDPDNADHQALVTAAVETLPGAARPDFGVTVRRADNKQLTVEAALPGDAAPAEFFVAGEQGYIFGTPERAEKDGRTVFTVPIVERPDTKPAEGALHYTLSTATGAVEGTLPYP
ncbi:protein-disulfide reductase DsbD domain-containing protein [Neomesorhizobium albiziae]|nr:protein-disulfide reductase DsbD domain-containing protein [Mesorhizobium albiziae]